MAIRPLNELHDCELVNSDQDCRGWPVIDATGTRIGTVKEMLVDTDAQRVTSLVLDRGEAIPVGSVALQDGKVHARAAAAAAAGTDAAAATPARAAAEVDAGKAVVLPVIQEEMRIGKRQVASGGVRVSTKVEERPVHEKVSLREEQVKVERLPADHAVAKGEDAFKERSFVVPSTAEEPVVEKRARVVGEVAVSKEVKEREAVVDDKLRRTDVEVTDKTTGKDRSPGRP